LFNGGGRSSGKKKKVKTKPSVVVNTNASQTTQKFLKNKTGSHRKIKRKIGWKTQSVLGSNTPTRMGSLGGGKKVSKSWVGGFGVEATCWTNSAARAGGVNPHP